MILVFHLCICVMLIELLIRILHEVYFITKVMINFIIILIKNISLFFLIYLKFSSIIYVLKFYFRFNVSCFWNIYHHFNVSVPIDLPFFFLSHEIQSIFSPFFLDWWEACCSIFIGWYNRCKKRYIVSV